MVGRLRLTFILHALLRNTWRYVREGVVEPRVTAVSIELPGLGATAQLRAARARLGAELRSRGLLFTERSVVVTGDSAHQEGLILPQLWLAHGTSQLETDEDLYVGWCAGDDVLRHREPVQRAFDAMQRIGKKTGRLILPLEYVEKRYTLDRLRELDLLDLTWTCEHPLWDDRPCLDCKPCAARSAAS